MRRLPNSLMTQRKRLALCDRLWFNMATSGKGDVVYVFICRCISSLQTQSARKTWIWAIARKIKVAVYPGTTVVCRLIVSDEGRVGQLGLALPLFLATATTPSALNWSGYHCN